MDPEPLVEGEVSSPAGKSERAAIIWRILADETVLKLVALRLGAVFEKILEEPDRIR